MATTDRAKEGESILKNLITNKVGIAQRKLTSADNLNNITESGIYRFDTGNTPKNSFYQNASIVEVFSVNIGTIGFTIQRETRVGVSSCFAFRSMSTDTAWHEWDEIALKDDLTTTLKYIRVLTPADDLDTLIAPGLYYFETDNAPKNSYYQNASVVEVLHTSSDSYGIIQRETRIGAAGASAWRARSRLGWASWTEAAITGHKHAAGDITSGTLPVARGGTGATSAAAARTNLSVYSKSEVDTKLSAKANASSLQVHNLKLQIFHIDNCSLAANTQETFQTSIAVSGWTPIGVAYNWISNASSGGVNVTACTVQGISFDDGPVVKVKVFNSGTSAAKIMCGVRILYFQ